MMLVYVKIEGEKVLIASFYFRYKLDNLFIRHNITNLIRCNNNINADDHCQQSTIMSAMGGKRFLSKEKSGKSVVIAQPR